MFVGSSQNLVLIIAFGCPICLPNFIPIEACIPKILCLCKKKKKNNKKKPETFVSCISEMAGMIYFKFEM